MYTDGPVRRWMTSGDKYMEGYSRTCSKSRVSIMVWMVIEAGGRAKLVLCDHRQDSASYIERILTPSLNFIRHRNPSLRGSIVFQQDNASCHVSRQTMAWMRSHRVNVLDPWPAMSPDLNLVEHCWAAIAREMVGHHYATKEELWVGVQEAWARVPGDFVPKLYDSMVRRLTAVVVARGGNTRY